MMCVLEVRKVRLVHIPRVLIKMREGGLSNGSFWRIWRASVECYHSMHRAGLPVPWYSVLRKPFAKTRQLLPF